MKFWLPCVRTGGVSTEYPDQVTGADGWYIEFGWFGLMFGLVFAKAIR